MCEGCEKSFCDRDFVVHRQELTEFLEILIDERRRIEEKLRRNFLFSSGFDEISRWESNSIRKIRLAAENARTQWKTLVEQKRKQIEKFGRVLKSSLENELFSEIELNRWSKQLKQIENELNQIKSTKLVENDRPKIFSNRSESSPKENLQDFFLKTSSAIEISENGRVLRHVGADFHYVNVFSRRVFSRGTVRFTFSLEKFSKPYRIFFGCASTFHKQKEFTAQSSNVVGWFGHNEIYRHALWNNNQQNHGYKTDAFQIDDLLDLVFDFNKKQVELLHRRIQKKFFLTVDTDKAPLPWRLFIILTRTDDQISLKDIQTFSDIE